MASSAFSPIEDVSTVDKWKNRPLHRGMSEENPIKDLIDTWKPRKALADRIGANIEAVHKWAASGRIPSDWQAEVVIAARESGLTHVTADWMLDKHRREAGAA